jgi:hypothetical protein
MKQVVTMGSCAPVMGASTDTQIEKEDYLTKRGAMGLAKQLERFWHDRNYPAARFWAEPIDERFAKVGTYEIYRINCNLVNGLPPRYRDDPR